VTSRPQADPAAAAVDNTLFLVADAVADIVVVGDVVITVVVVAAVDDDDVVAINTVAV